MSPQRHGLCLHLPIFTNLFLQLAAGSIYQYQVTKAHACSHTSDSLVRLHCHCRPLHSHGTLWGDMSYDGDCGSWQSCLAYIFSHLQCSTGAVPQLAELKHLQQKYKLLCSNFSKRSEGGLVRHHCSLSVRQKITSRRQWSDSFQAARKINNPNLDMKTHKLPTTPRPDLRQQHPICPMRSESLSLYSSLKRVHAAPHNYQEPTQISLVFWSLCQVKREVHFDLRANGGK